MLIDRIDWGAADPAGRIAEASVMDVQAFFQREKMTRDRVPFDRVAPAAWIADVAAALGPYSPPAGSAARGCR